MQESKRNATDPVLKTTNLINYQVFELKRVKTKEEGGKGLHGGGLAVGALHDLNPVLIRNGSDDIECVTIEVTTDTARIRCVTGYGPQESDCTSRKEKFWSFLDMEVHSAKEDDVGLVIEIDSNAWAGDSIIPKDPNRQNNNGKRLEMFLKRNKNITLVNSLPLCEGLVTRKRQTQCLNEKSVLDLFLVCEKILPFVTGMHVDEKGEYQLSNFYGKHHKGTVTESDHAMIQLHMNLKFIAQKPQRTETFNFKNAESRYFFKDITTDTSEFSNCFLSNETFQTQVKTWEHTLKDHVVQAFQKIRSRKRKFVETDIGELLEKRKRLKLDNVQNPETIDNIESLIADKT